MSNLLQILMGILSGGITLSGGSGGTVLQTDPSSTYDSTVGIRFNTDGTIETGKSLDGAAITWSPAGTWINPISAADGTYSVRFTNKVQDLGVGDWSAEAAADDTWIALSAQRVWTSNKTAAGERKFTVDFEVRKTAGPPPVTGSSQWVFHIDNVV